MLRAFLSFDTFLFPSLTKIIYWVGLALIALGTIVGALGALASMANPMIGAGGFLGFIVALIAGAIGLVVWRIAVELWLVLFSIYDVLKDIRDGRRG
jgi:hypothetical protein